MRSRLAAVLVLGLLVAGVGAPFEPAGAAKAKPASPATIAARQRFFGKQNANPRTGGVRSDRVILSWFSVANYAAALDGHVVLLDAWVARGSHSGYVPTTPQELIDLAPEYIFIGHGDFDHAADAAEVAAGSGATIVGTAGTATRFETKPGTTRSSVSRSPRTTHRRASPQTSRSSRE